MNDHPVPDSLRNRAASLAADGDWTALQELLRSEPTPVLLADPRLAYHAAEALYHTGHMAELAEFAEAYERASREAADVVATMKALNLGGIAAFELGRTSEAEVRFDLLMELAEAEGDQDMLARAANNLGALANLKGRRHEAIAYYNLAIPLYAKLGQVRGLAQSHHNLGMSYRDLDLLDDSVEEYKRSVVLAYRIDYVPLVAMATTGRAESELRRGDGELARELAARGLQAARDVGDPISEAEALRVCGLTYAKSHGGDLDKARGDFEAALELARATGNALLEAEVERDLGRVEQADARPAEAVRLLESAHERFLALGAVAAARDVATDLSSLRN